MTVTSEVARERDARAVKWPQPPAAPRWMTWTPQAAVLLALTYGAVRVWWAIKGAPSFGALRYDLIFFSGWSAVALCAAAAVAALALRFAPWRWPLLPAASLVCLAMLAACPLLLLDLVSALLPGFGAPFHWVAFLSRAGCFTAGILLGATAVAYRRPWRSDCLFCGRTGAVVRPAQPPQWAWWAAYAAVAGCMVRLGAQAAIGFGMMRHMPGAVVFETGFLLAGTLLPLSLVHSWGRIVPRWVPLLASRRIPRWLPLAPALVFGGLMTVYFGVTLMKVVAVTLAGTAKQEFAPFPLSFFWVAVPGYWVWGVGMLVAALAYSRITKPVCRVCGC